MIDPKHKQLLTNMLRIPDKKSTEYDQFWENEARKAEYGVTIDGVFIHGWLYWHTQLWNIIIDEEDQINHIIKRTVEKATFRDNEWIIADGLQEAEETRKGMMLFGARRLGKSEFLASYVARKAILYEKSENAVTGGNWDDIDIATGKIILGITELQKIDYFKCGFISNNPRKAIELGWKSKKGEPHSWSIIKVRNFDNGINTEAAAGITASSFVIDEIGKFKFAPCFAAAKPAFTSEFGWRCSPILTGTSGDIKKASDAEKFFLNPDAYNFIVRTLAEEGNKKVSIFISGLRRMEGKYKTTLADYVKTEKGILVPKNSELYTVPFKNSDFTKANNLIDAERAQAAKSPDPSALLKETMYYPKNTKELFLQDGGNNFPIDALNEHIAYLLANPELQGTPVRLYRDVNTKVKISYNTDKKALNDYPLKSDANKDGAIIIYELPADDFPFYLYISGADPYNVSSSRWSNSLGACYIYKRFYDPLSGSFQRRIVAEYVARPKNGLKEFHETIEMLLELYNCVCMPENEAGIFLQYFDNKNKSHYLADGFSHLKEINPRTTISSDRNKGLPATKKVQEHYKELVYQYLTEVITIGFNPETGEAITKLGLVRIPSIGLCREFVAWSEDGNFDRYVAFGHTLEHEIWADKIYPNVKVIDEAPKPEQNPKDKQPIVLTSPFVMGSSNPFNMYRTHTGQNPFGLPMRKQ